VIRKNRITQNQNGFLVAKKFDIERGSMLPIDICMARISNI